MIGNKKIYHLYNKSYLPSKIMKTYEKCIECSTHKKFPSEILEKIIGTIINKSIAKISDDKELDDMISRFKKFFKKEMFYKKNKGDINTYIINCINTKFTNGYENDFLILKLLKFNIITIIKYDAEINKAVKDYYEFVKIDEYKLDILNINILSLPLNIFRRFPNNFLFTNYYSHSELCTIYQYMYYHKCN